MASLAVGQDVEQSVGIGRDDRLAHRQRFEGSDWRSLPERWEDAEVEGGKSPRDIAMKTAEDKSIAESKPAACAWRSWSSGPSPTRKKRTFGRSVITRAAASIRYEFPLDSCRRVTVPTANSWGSIPSSARAAATSAALRLRLNSSSGTPR